MTWRPSGFRLGTMRDRIKVQTESDTQNDDGQPVTSWIDWLTSEPASHYDKSGYESMRGKQVEAGITTVFTVRFRPGYTTQMSVVFDEKRFGIVHVNAIDGGRRYLELLCKYSGECGVENNPHDLIDVYVRPSGDSIFQPDGSSYYLVPS